eukprot:GEMP01023682.1.p1 GENE.GEMP01023682.1~~GEMP01023682.1.p1  ORF type:complete len:316 (+),score=60.78 GEMP01023682.1:73-1020(+)
MVSIDCNLPTLLPVEIPPQLTTPDEENDESLSTRTSPTNKRTESMVSYVLPTGNITIDFPESPRDVLLRREIVNLVGVPHVFVGDLGAPDEDDSQMPSTADNTHTTVTDDDEYLSRSVSWKCLTAVEGKGCESNNSSSDREEKNDHDVPQEATTHQSCDKDRKQWTEKIRGSIDFFRGQLHKIQLKKEQQSRAEIQPVVVQTVPVRIQPSVQSRTTPWFHPPQFLKPAYLSAPRIFAPYPLMAQPSYTNPVRLTSFSNGATTHFVVRTATSMRAIGFQNGIQVANMPSQSSLGESLHSHSSAPPRLTWMVARKSA